MRPDLDQKLTRLREASEQVAGNLVELEIDSSRQLLDASTLEGESAARWSAASEALTELWRRRELLEGVLERADKLRRSRRNDELRQLLDGRSIELATAHVPLPDRKLLGNPQVAERCSPDELLARMSSSFDEVKTVLAQIGGAWETLIPRLDAARRLLQECSRLYDEVGGAGRRDLEATSRRLDALSVSVTTDPLSVSADDVDAVTTRLGALREQLDADAALKRGFESRILEARQLVERVRRAIADVQTAHEEVLAKIAGNAAPPPPRAPDELGAELVEITEVSGGGDWREARRLLGNLTANATSLLDDAERTLAANRAPIEARNEFRALLEAYQVKAARLGMLEDARLAEIFSQVQEALYTAPTDLATAAQLIRSYQQALSAAQTEGMP